MARNNSDIKSMELFMFYIFGIKRSRIHDNSFMYNSRSPPCRQNGKLYGFMNF